jgi:hypothetical protein
MNIKNTLQNFSFSDPQSETYALEMNQLHITHITHIQLALPMCGTNSSCTSNGCEL